jgi:hypothetical protein
MSPNTEKQSIVVIFDAHTAAAVALKAVQRAGLERREVSVVAISASSPAQLSAMSHEQALT